MIKKTNLKLKTTQDLNGTKVRQWLRRRRRRDDRWRWQWWRRRRWRRRLAGPSIGWNQPRGVGRHPPQINMIIPGSQKSAKSRPQTGAGMPAARGDIARFCCPLSMLMHSSDPSWSSIRWAAHLYRSSLRDWVGHLIPACM